MKREYLGQQEPQKKIDLEKAFEQAAREQAAKQLKVLDDPFKQGSGHPSQKSRDEYRAYLENQVRIKREEDLKADFKQINLNIKSFENYQKKSTTAESYSDKFNYIEAENSRIKQHKKQKLEYELKIVEHKIKYNEKLINTTKKEIKSLEYKLDNNGEMNDLLIFISLILGVFIIAGIKLAIKTKSNG